MQIICEDVCFVCVKLVIYTALCTVLNYNFFCAEIHCGVRFIFH